MGWKRLGVVCAFLVFLSNQIIISKSKTIKLIVPHKIKYIHHTHVLLVKPKKKAAAKIVEEVEEDGPANYQHLHYHHEMPRHKGKTKLHYVLPYVAESKDGVKEYSSHLKNEESDDEQEPYFVPVHNYRKGRMTPKEVHPPKISKKTKGHQSEVTAPSTRYATKYLYQPQEEFVKEPLIDPQQYETKYLGYTSYSEMEPPGPYAEATSYSDSDYALTLPDITTPSPYKKNGFENYARPYGYSKWIS